MFKEKSPRPRFIEKNKLRQILFNNGDINSNKDKNKKIIINRNNPLEAYYTFNKSSSRTNFGSKISYEDYLLKKLSYFRKLNREINAQLNNISEKSNILLNDMNKNKLECLKLKKEYENELKVNNEMKSRLNILSKNKENEKEINEIKEEQNMLLLTLKSKDKIINNLKNTLNGIKKEIDEDKEMNESIINKKNEQILELKKILEQLNNKFEDNKKKINLKNEEKEKKKNALLDNNLQMKNSVDLNKSKNQEKKDIAQNIKDNKKESNIQKEETQTQIMNYKNYLNQNMNKNYSNNQRLLTISEKPDYNSLDSDNNNIKLSLTNSHKRINSSEIVRNIPEIIENGIYSYTEGNIIKDIPRNKETNKDSFYLYTITKEGKLIEFDLMEKKYRKINTKEIKDWNIFISQYKTFYEGSLLLNTFQGLFILTGKYYKDLFYFSKKYNSVSKINQLNYGHKYGALILTPNSENIIVIGGESKEVEILNIENGQIQQLSNLLTKRVNSAYAFIDDKIFAFFGRNNNQIEYLDMKNKSKWELIKFNNKDNKLSNYEGLAAIPINNKEILIVGNMINNKAMRFKFNYNKSKIDYCEMGIKYDNSKYTFDKDKYFNNFINFEKFGKDGNYLNQFVGIDSLGNIHYINNDLTYSVLNYDPKI